MSLPYIPTRAARRRSLTTSLLLCSLASWPYLADAQIKAVPLPDPHIPGYQFPEPEITILNWIQGYDKGQPASADRGEALTHIALHGWGIWAALTSETDQVFEGEKLRVFETWYTPEDLRSPTVQGMAEIGARTRGRAPLRNLNQLRHGRSAKANADTAKEPPVERILGFVKYDPSAAEHIVKQKLLLKATLDSLLADGANAISPFPSSAVSIKPVFRLITKDQLKNGRYYPLPVWTGPPSPVRQYASDQWPGMVWIDVQGGGGGKGDIDLNARTNADGSTRSDATTYPVSSLIHFKLNAADAADLNSSGSFGVTNTAAGDYAILLAMHVTSKEMTRWTWQTFWWTPTPDTGTPPSSGQVVAARPLQLKGAPQNYAMSPGYEMETPSQPYVGGSNVGQSSYSYNPWLEAGFGPADLPDSKPGMSQGQVVSNSYGVQTSCMSCHANANYHPTSLPTAPKYTGAQYIDLDSPRFLNVLKVDFLWSIPGNAE